ncbi:HTH_48 domain-containing protein [Trichonephila clavipes]|nr:HTH_48 domain-containing protein [Trichonephila clavipes]
MEVTRVEQRTDIKIVILRRRNAMECHSELVEALVNNALPYRTVARWVGKFQQIRVSTSDEQRSGRPVRRGVRDKRPDLVDSAIILLDIIKQSVYDSYSDVEGWKNWSTHRTVSTFRPVTLISFPRLRNQCVVGGLQHETTLVMLYASK